MHVTPGHKMGVEPFLDMIVHVTEEPLAFTDEVLDPAGKNALTREAMDGVTYCAVKGQAEATWKTSDRGRCIEREKKEPNTHKCVCGDEHATRWDSVLCFAEHLKQGKTPEVIAVYMHPSLTGHINNCLIGIDGSRRIMAHLEANINEFDVVILRAKAT